MLPPADCFASAKASSLLDPLRYGNRTLPAAMPLDDAMAPTRFHHSTAQRPRSAGAPALAIFGCAPCRDGRDRDACSWTSSRASRLPTLQDACRREGKARKVHPGVCGGAGNGENHHSPCMRSHKAKTDASTGCRSVISLGGRSPSRNRSDAFEGKRVHPRSRRRPTASWFSPSAPQPRAGDNRGLPSRRSRRLTV